MGMVNKPSCRTTELEKVALEWGRIINSARAPRPCACSSSASIMLDDGLVGQQIFAGEATRLAYGTEEAKEGRDAFVDKRPQDYSRFPWHY